MNTRFKKLQPLPERPSVKWHLMHEEYYPIFQPDRREQVECWYNKTATGKQRDTFRRICKEVYTQDPARAEPEYAASYSLEVRRCEARLMMSHYGVVLSEEGKARARVWVLHASERDRMSFREVFTGAQSLYIPDSVMRVDYVAPDGEYYADIDRTHFLNSVDWASHSVHTEMQSRQKRKDMRRPSEVVADRLRSTRPRFTKPKGQFDGFAPLAALGYTGTDQDDAMEQLRKKLEESAESDRYYTENGCTVYVAGGGKKSNSNTANSIKGGVIANVLGN